MSINKSLSRLFLPHRECRKIYQLSLHKVHVNIFRILSERGGIRYFPTFKPVAIISLTRIGRVGIPYLVTATDKQIEVEIGSLHFLHGVKFLSEMKFLVEKVIKAMPFLVQRLDGWRIKQKPFATRQAVLHIMEVEGLVVSQSLPKWTIVHYPYLMSLLLQISLHCPGLQHGTVVERCVKSDNPDFHVIFLLIHE